MLPKHSFLDISLNTSNSLCLKPNTQSVLIPQCILLPFAQILKPKTWMSSFNSSTLYDVLILLHRIFSQIYLFFSINVTLGLKPFFFSWTYNLGKVSLGSFIFAISPFTPCPILNPYFMTQLFGQNCLLFLTSLLFVTLIFHMQFALLKYSPNFFQHPSNLSLDVTI